MSTVTAVVVEERDQTQVLVVQSTGERELTQSLLGELGDAEVGRVTSREPTLEDAYVALVTARVMRNLRLLGVGWLLHFKMLSQSAFDGFLAILWPLFFATVAFFMFRSGRGSRALGPVALGAAVMGMWSATSVSAVVGAAARAAARHARAARRGARQPRRALALPVTLATSTIGIYCIVATLLWARFAFGIHVPVAHPLPFALGIVGIVITIGSLGFLMAVAFVRFARAWALGAASEYPGLADLRLPRPALAAAALGAAARRGCSRRPGACARSVMARSAATRYGDIAMCSGSAAVYIAGGVLVLGSVLNSARKRATLSLT